MPRRSSLCDQPLSSNNLERRFSQNAIFFENMIIFRNITLFFFRRIIDESCCKLPKWQILVGKGQGVGAQTKKYDVIKKYKIKILKIL